MSTIKQMADQEADATEAELGPDEELEPDGEPDDEPETENEVADVQTPDFEKMFASLDKEATRHAKRVTELLGPELSEFTPCPLCHPSVPGLAGPVGPDGFDPERRIAVLIAMGEDAARKLKQAPEARMCEVCDGGGWCTTGAKPGAQPEKMCDTCQGNGWRTKLASPIDLAQFRVTELPPVAPI